MMAGDVTQRLLADFSREHGTPALHLACHAALPVVLNSELVHLLRINFFMDADLEDPYVAEARLLLSFLCREIDDGLYVIEPDTREALLRELVTTYGYERVTEVAALLWEYTQRVAPWLDRTGLTEAQQLTAKSFVDPDGAIAWLETAEELAGATAVVDQRWFVAMRRDLNRLRLLTDAAQNYADLEIRIDPLRGDSYPITLVVDRGREFRGVLDASILPWTAGYSPEQDGEWLFDKLFADLALRSAWGEARGRLRRRIRLAISQDAPELHAIPWELLREHIAPYPPVTLAAAGDTPFSRYLYGGWEPGQLIQARPVRMLVAVANPDGLAKLGLTPIDLAKEWHLVREAASHPGMELELLPQPCTLAALADKLAEGFHILHLVCHGAYNRDDGVAALYLADDSNQMVRVHDHEIVDALRNRLSAVPEKDRLRLIFLASCETATRSPADAFRGLARRLVTAGVPAVLAMQDKVPVKTAQAFAGTFYEKLLQHGLIDLASNQARAHVIAKGLPGPSIPMLLMRLNNGRLLEVRSKQELPVHVVQPIHSEYLLRLFHQTRWADVSMTLFDPTSVRRVNLAEIYTTLPVNFALFLRTAEGKVTDWWCGHSDQDPEKFAEQEPLKQIPSQSPHARVHNTVGESQIQQRTWAELGADEDALRPLLNMAQQWAAERSSQGDHKGVLRWQADAFHAALIQPRLVIVGDPGSGKSTFLRHLSLCWAGTLLREAGVEVAPATPSLDALPGWTRAYTPIYVELRTLVSTFQPPPADPSQGVDLPGVAEFRQYIRNHLSTYGDEVLSDTLFGLLRQGRAAILLDGLDEVSQSSDSRRQAQIQAFVAELVKEFESAPIIVTARPYAYRQSEWALEGFGRAELAPLDASRRADMAQRLLGQLLGQNASRQVGAFVAALDAIPDDLRSNPLLLTLLAALWVRKPEHERHLPSTRGELHRRALALLLVDWVRTKVEGFSVEKDLQLSPEDLRLVLELVACHAQEQRSRPDELAMITEGSIYTALRLIGRGRVSYDLLAHLEQQAGMLLETVEGGPGVLVATFEKQYRFVYPSFQEYLAACELLHRPEEMRPHGLPVLPVRSFPKGLAQYMIKAPELWANVLRLAVDELFYQKRAADAWELLSLCCEPYCRAGEAAQAAVLALLVALEAEMLEAVPDRRVRSFFQDLCDAATAALSDHEHLTPEQRDIAGRLLGSGRFPGHDRRLGVGVTSGGLPAIDWVIVPKLDPSTGRGDWIFQDEQHQPLETFWIARYPITYAQFQTFLDASDGFHDERWWTGLAASLEHRSTTVQQWFQYWNHPKDCVSWYDAIAFCRWLTEKAREHPDLLPVNRDRDRPSKITLPTELQWEKTARGHDSRQYPWGNEYHQGRVNIYETGVGPHYLRKTSAVGMYPQSASPYGIADLSGNVWEWCLNEYRNPENIQEEGIANRVVRGGSWDNGQRSAVASFRYRNFPFSRDNGLGFRVCAVIQQE